MLDDPQRSVGLTNDGGDFVVLQLVHEPQDHHLTLNWRKVVQGVANRLQLKRSLRGNLGLAIVEEDLVDVLHRHRALAAPEVLAAQVIGNPQEPRLD